jgi:dCTP diphosphatase
MSDIQKITDRIKKYRDERDWKQFHNPKDSAIALMLEAAELLEHFQWKNGKEMEDYLAKNKEAVAEELVDIMHWVFLMASDLDIDLPSTFERKMDKNEKKYPVEKFKGKTNKYNQI